ncbi:uncharacterized protein LOC132839004 [Tachysurus vachellii]|uniref:uncharacterized protein LOC132839004 n=1 Tax=Tachysurus vachellii TaxID=175792 RepID=UPI00296B0A33|nr:uncharacterized protein LOC132839004 [Tachysurus vachellii]
MGRVKKGQRMKRKDLCAMVGGMDALVRTMRSVNISKTDTGYSSKIWSELSQSLFGEDHKKNRHWLWVMWTTNRNGVKDLVTKQQTNDPQVMNNKATDCETEEPSVFKTDKNDEERQVTEDEQQDVSLQNIVQVEEAITDVEVELDQIDGEDEQQNVSLQSGIQTEHGKRGNTKQWRKMPVCSKRFIITVNRKKWQTVVPLQGSTKLRQPWTHVLYNSFRKKNPCCTLSFKSQHIKTPHSRKINSPYLNITAVCTFPSCSAKYFFKRKKEPVADNPVKISVLQKGQIAHKKSERKFRPATNTKKRENRKNLRQRS